MLYGGAVTWRSSKQVTITDTTIESEYIIENEVAKEVVWLKKFINNWGVVPRIVESI